VTIENQLGSIKGRLDQALLRMRNIEEDHDRILEEIGETQELIAHLQADLVTLRAQMGGHT
jgi:chromosome segregation ATPase